MPSWFQRFPVALLFLLTIALVACALVVLAKPVAVLSVAHKIGVLAMAALIGWWLDHVVLFPYARPAGYLAVPDWRAGGLSSAVAGAPRFPVVAGYFWLFAIACGRRALLVGLSMIAAALVL